MDDLPFCSIVLPALNEERDIADCLASLSHQTYPRECYEILVIDNGSTDDTQNIALKYADNVLQITDVNVGAVRNFGAKQAKGSILVCTDSDCLVEPSWLESGVRLLQENPNHVFGGGLKPRTGATWIERYWLLNDDGNAIQQVDLMGSCIFCWKDHFFQVGGFDEQITSGEDSDLSLRFKSDGYQVVMNGTLSLVHSGSPQDATHFIKRQIWHSENYLKNIKGSLSDKVFWITSAYLTLSIILMLGTVTANAVVLNLLLLHQTMPLALSIKRLKRSKQRIKSLKYLAYVIMLDNLYLAGRSIGLIKGLINQQSKGVTST